MRASSFVLGTLAGAALGALVAPQRGRDTRRAIGRRLGRRADGGEVHAQSATALAGEALRTGVSGRRPAHDPEMPEQDLLRMGDPDVDALSAAYVGDEAAGGDMPTPDQDRVDDIGRAYGVSEADEGELRVSSEILSARDRRR
jgi:hypothetical protein